MKKLFINLILILFFLTPVDTHAAASVSASNNLGLVGYWSFEEGRGTFVTDASGNNNKGTLQNGPVWSVGKIGNSSLSFDGSDDYISIPNSSSLQPLLGNWSVSFWIKRTGTGSADYPQIIGSRPWTAGLDKGWSVSLQAASGKIGGHFADGSTGFDVTNNLSSSATALNTWEQWTVVFDRTNSQILYYKNGFLDASSSPSFPSGSINQTDNIYMGREIGGNNNRKLQAVLDDVRVYNRSLSATEAANIYANNAKATKVNVSTKDTLSSGLIGYWTFDGKSMTSATATDVSGNGNDEAFVNAPAVTSGVIGQAIDLKRSSNQYLRATNSPSLNIPTGGSVTMCTWMKSRVGSQGYYQAVMGKREDSSSPQYSYGINFSSNNFQVYTSGASGVRSFPYNLPANTWTHVCGVISATSPTALYVNGSLLGTSGSGGGVVSNPVSSFVIGATQASGNEWFDGLMDDVRLYNRALSASEVKQLYNLGSGSKANASSAAATPSTGNATASHLVGWWTFDGKDMTTSTSTDKSGNGHDGRLINSPKPVLGKIGQALNFDSSLSSYIDTGTTFPSLTNNFTISFWVKPGSTQVQYADIFGNHENGYHGLLFQQNGNSLNNYYFGYGDGGAWRQSPNISLTTGVWQHVLIIKSSTQINVYKNGVLISSTNNSSVMVPSTTNFMIAQGFSGLGRPFNGLIDDFRIYDTVLSTSEIKQLYNSGK